MDPEKKRLLVAKGVVLSLLSIFQMGYVTAYPNTAIDSFRTFFNESTGGITENSFNWIWSSTLNVYFVGFAAGSWIAVPLTDRIGRKWGLFVGNLLNFLSALLSFFSIVAHFPWIFFFGRILIAVAAAISMNSLILLLQEASPSSLRGLMSFNAEMAFVVMNLVGAVAGMRAFLGRNLLLLLGLAIVPTFFSVLLVLYFHESPKFLALQRKDDEAANRALQFYQGLDSTGCTVVLTLISEEKSDEKCGVFDVFKAPKTAFGLLLGIVTMQLTSSLWPILYFSTELLRKTGIEPETAEAVSSTMVFVSSLSTLVGMVLVERLPRKKLLLASAAVNVSALFLFVASEMGHHYFSVLKYGCVVAVVCHGITYSIGLGPIAWFLTSELTPQHHRAICQSITLSVNQLGALVLCLFTLPLYNTLGAMIILILFAIPGCFCLLFLWKYLPETRNRSIVDIAEPMNWFKSKLFIVTETELPLNVSRQIRI